MQHPQHVDIDLKKLSEIAHVGVRRAVIFMGLGLNAAARDDFYDYQLYKLPIVPNQTSALIDLFPLDLPETKVNEFKREFALWVTGCGLRELLEHYAIFLDHIHRYSLLVYQVNNKLGCLDPVKEQKTFNLRFGVPAKLATLRKRFQINPDYSQSICQLYAIRNCLTHGLGMVNRTSDLFLTWRGMDTVMTNSDGGVMRVYSDFMGKRVEEDSTIALRFVNRERRFQVGQKIRLSQQDLAEICHFFVSTAIPTMVQSFMKFLKLNGIAVSGEAE